LSPSCIRAVMNPASLRHRCITSTTVRPC
jgi:hypothetical protein